jgi:g-D-glutamyl-meso-diaminopimelate peptidase
MQNKINYDVLVIAVIICIIIINIIYIFNNGLVLDSGYMNSFSKKVYKDYSDYITSKSESDKQVINSYFSEGMSLEDYKSIIDRKSIVVNSNGKYNKIDYDFDRKLHYSDIEDMLYNMNNLDIVNLEIIGKSVDNRNIYGIEIGKGNRVIYIDANAHSAEVGNTPILMRFLGEILNKYNENDEEVVNQLNNVKLAIIPSINPDIYEVYNFGIESINNKSVYIYQNKDLIDFANIKCNANGVDINRNLPSQNSGLYFNSEKLYKNVSTELTTNVNKHFPGFSLGSEPETRASMFFMLKHFKNVVAYIDMHSQGRVIYSGKPNLPQEFNDKTLEFASKVSSFTGYKIYGPSREEVGEGIDGTLTDFMAELACGFKFSSETGRLSTDKYVNNSSEFKYKYPVVTIETLKTWTDDPNVFKDEYYNHGLRNLLYDLLNF